MSTEADPVDSQELIAAYKAILRDVLDKRPSGMRQRLAEAIGKNRSFVSQISNSAYQVPIPARHLGLIFEICHFSAQERATFLKAYSRAHPGRLTVAAETIDLSQLADELAAEFRARATTVDHGLELAPEPPVPAVGDAERVLQIGRVLVENALVHTPSGTSVRVSSALDGGRATLTVANDGPLIPPEAQHQVFERFFRLDGARASGSGLGLAIARELAELMGGRIELDSQNGWTLFTLALPADVTREPDAVPA